ncbi:MAG: Na(+)/H(+) antiporter subunit D [Emergencia sp.]
MINLHPGLVLIAGGLFMLILPYKGRIAAGIAAPVIALWSTLQLDEQSALSYVFTDSITLELIKADRLGFVFALIFSIISLIAGIYSLNKEARGEKCAMLVYAGSSICVALAGDYTTLIVFWEIMALSSWFVVWSGGRRSSRLASYRYLVLHFLGGNMLLAGVIALYCQGITQVGAVTTDMGAAFWLILIGVGVNAAIVPLHTWIPDAYPEAGIEGTVYLGSFTTKVGIYCLIRMFAGTEFLLVFGVIMALFGAAMALIENDLRRLLSYHIISQLGYMVVALAAGGALGIDGASAHAFNNILYKATLLMCAGAVIRATGKRKITELGGLYRKMPVTAICFLIASFAISGVPFFNGFASKALVMEALTEGGHVVCYWLMTIASIGTWMSVALKINWFVFFGSGAADGAGERIQCEKTPWYMNLAMIIGAASCIVTGVLPKILYSILPYASDGHPFTMHHIMEYVALFIGSTLVFYLFRKIMAPHDMISLDFDWIYRKPLAWAVFGISGVLHSLFSFADLQVMRCVGTVKSVCGHKRAPHHQEEYAPVGVFMLGLITVCVICAVMAAMR